MNLTFYYNPFSQAMSKCRTLSFLKISKKKRGRTNGLLRPYFYLDLSYPHTLKLSSLIILISSLSFLTQPEPQKQTSYLLPSFLWDKDNGICFSRASSSSRCWNHFQKKKNYGLDWQYRFSETLEGIKNKNHWLVELKKVGFSAYCWIEVPCLNQGCSI